MREHKQMTVSVDKCTKLAKNARKHSEAQLKQIMRSIEQFGFLSPIVIDKKGVVHAGNGRLEAARRLRIKEVPAIQAEGLTADQLRAFALADNRIGETSEWDVGLLKEELEELIASVDVDMQSIGFSDEEILALVGKLDSEESSGGLQGDPDEIPEQVETRAKPGDLWKLGEHRLLCGDSTKAEDVARLMDGEKADMVFTDPPYGIAYKSPSGRGKTKRGDYSVIIGDDKPFEPSCLFGNCDLIVAWGANHYADKLPPSAAWLVWDKRDGDAINNNSDCELAWVSSGGSARLFHHKWNGMIKASEKSEQRVHPTQKPVALSEWAFETLSAGENILDLFGGSGSTLIACEKTGRKCFMMELDPKYADIILARWEKLTGKTAELLEAGDVHHS